MRVLSLGGVFIFLIYLLVLASGLITEHAPPVPASEFYPSVEDVYADFDTIKTPLHDYAWPTDASRTITSTFGEYRKTHFHAGVDISTHNRMGYKVLASRDGYVWRIRISQSGYGKILYLKHEDGYITTYAHLKTFADSINAIARREQFRLERYPIDITLDPKTLPVKKGEVIAYTGNSGTGSPHLHFEIRDENFNPVNPQLFDDIALDDSLQPRIYSVAVIPLDDNSLVNRNKRPSILNTFVGQEGRYRLPQSIDVTGRVGLGINTRDRVVGTYHRVGIHRLELYLNDSLSFSAQLDRLPSNESKQILLFYYLPLIKSRRGRFHQLFIENSSSLPIFEKRLPGAGIIDAHKLGEGEHPFTIVCKDFRGNATTLTGTLKLSVPPEKMPYLTSSTVDTENKSDIFTILPDESGWHSFDSHTLQIVYDSGAVFRPLNVQLRKELHNGFTFYRLSPQDVLLNNGIRVFIRSSQPRKTATDLYVRTNHRFEFQPSTFDTATGYYSTPLTNTLGDIALFEDSRPPQISSLRLNLRGNRPLVRFRVYDDIAGIDANEIKTYIDGDFVIPEIDERWRIHCNADRSLEKGKHQLTINVKDNVGNQSTMTRTFYVK